MTRVVFGLAAAMLLSLTAGQAFADDYVALCKANEQGNPDADKICTCASGKVAAADRPAALKALKAINDTMNGKGGDNSSAEVATGMSAAMAAEAACM